jgi:hypothetical protein
MKNSLLRKFLVFFLSMIVLFMTGGMIAVLILTRQTSKICNASKSPSDIPIVTSVPSVPSVPPVTQGPIETRSPSRWAPFKAKPDEQTPNQWSFDIYNAITGGASAGENLNGGGVNSNVALCGLGLRPNLTQTQADCICKNPCTWYGQTAADKIQASGMCDCTTLKATNYL